MARVLIIDDESNIRMMLRLALEHVGHQVGQAADGEEGLARFGEGTAWDLVLLDQRMPGKEGLEVLAELRQRSPAAKVILISAFGTVDLASQALRAGATDFLRKPFTVEVLRAAVAAALAAEPPVASSLSFDRVGINGYRFTGVAGVQHRPDGTLEKLFEVQRTLEERQLCQVLLTPRLQEQTRHALPTVAHGASFWELLCGEALANYLWQEASLPQGGQLMVEELTRGLRRWVEAVEAQP